MKRAMDYSGSAGIGAVEEAGAAASYSPHPPVGHQEPLTPHRVTSDVVMTPRDQATSHSQKFQKNVGASGIDDTFWIWLLMPVISGNWKTDRPKAS